MSITSWVAVVGIGLQVVGILIAILGIRSQFRAFFEERMIDHRVRRLRAWLSRSENASVRPEPMRSRTRGFKPKLPRWPSDPNSSVPVQEQLDNLSEWVEALQQAVQDGRADTRARVGALRATVRDGLRDQSKRLGRVNREIAEIRTGITGTDGSGLRTAVLGLFLTAVGVAMTAPIVIWPPS